MPLVRGQIVRSKAGRDKDTFLVVLSQTGKDCLLADGKHRPLARPKLKNEKHLAPTNSFLTEEQLLTDQSVKRGLKDHARQVKGEA